MNKHANFKYDTLFELKCQVVFISEVDFVSTQNSNASHLSNAYECKLKRDSGLHNTIIDFIE